MNMKRIIVFLLIALLSFVVGCSSNNFTVTFDTNGGSQIQSQSVKEGERVNEPEIPVKEGFNFMGWYHGEEMYSFSSSVVNDITLTAKWEIKRYEIIFNCDGGSEVISQTVEHNGKIVRPEDPVKNGFVFDGWYVEEVEYDFNLLVTSNINLTAKWKDDNVTVEYQLVDGTTNVITQKTGTLFENIDQIVPNGMVFDGWYSEDGVLYNGETAVEKNLKVYPSVYTDGLIFEDNKVIGYVGSADEVILPMYANGKRITVIKEYAFQDSLIKQITFSSSIESIEKYAFTSCKSLSKVIFSDGLKVIGDGAFFDCSSIESIDLPLTVREIGYGAFAQKLYLFELESGDKAVMPDECALREITVPFIGFSAGYSDKSYLSYIFGSPEPTTNGYLEEGIEMQFGDNVYKVNLYSSLPASLKKVTVKGGEIIPDYAFYNCMYLEEIIIQSENIFSIGKSAFEGCFSADVSGVEVAEYISERAFMGSAFTGGDFVNLIEIGDMAFANTQIEEFEIYSAVESIGEGAFANTLLTQIIIPSNVQVIDDMAFYGCNNLVKVYFQSQTPCTLGSTLFTVVEDGLAYYSDVLIFVPEGDGQTQPYEEYRKDLYLRDYASGIFPVSYEGFLGYVVKDDILLGYIADQEENFKDIIIPVGVKEIADFAFYNLGRIESLTAPEGFEKIGKYAFYNCTSFKYLNMPSSMKEIDDYAFAGFFMGNNISRLYFPEGFKRIGDGAFLSSFNIKIINIPSTIEYLGYLCFGMSNSLERMYIKATTPPSYGEYSNGIEEPDNNVFSIVNSAKTIIYVPFGNATSGENAGSSYVDIYKNNPAFKDFASYIKATPEGKEVGHYGNGDLFIDLDGCNQAIIYTVVKRDSIGEDLERFEYKKEYGTYTLAGPVLKMTFESYGEINAIYTDRSIRYNQGGEEIHLIEPKRYYDDYNWTNFVLYERNENQGKGLFDMYGYYLTPFEWKIEGSVFKLYMDCNNVLPEHSQFAGVQEYLGDYNRATDTFTVSFMMNDYDVEIMTYTATYSPSVYATAKEESVYGTYKVYAENNADYVMFTLVSYGNGIVDVYIGESLYPDCSYIVDDDCVTIDLMGVIITLNIDGYGFLTGDFMGVNVTFVYEDALLPSTELPD